ncbi:MAG: endonuclease domain-containing protein [Bacteroidota bacterium]|nr:endonuclease domain-containing protein [Bacteroidota bacterium]
MPTGFHKGAPPLNFRHSKENRKQSTEAERLLWQQLRNRKLTGFKFRRQHPISDFIADFYCNECKLIVEIDGGYHDDREQIQYDRERTFQLNDLGLNVIRFTNREVIEQMDFVLKELSEHLLDVFQQGNPQSQHQRSAR